MYIYQVLISGREDPDAPLSPAMDATLRVFKRVSGLSSAEESGAGSTATMAAFCSLKLLVAASQAVHLIGKQGSTIKLIQESSGASVRVLTEGVLTNFSPAISVTSKLDINSFPWNGFSFIKNSGHALTWTYLKHETSSFLLSIPYCKVFTYIFMFSSVTTHNLIIVSGLYYCSIRLSLMIHCTLCSNMQGMP